MRRVSLTLVDDGDGTCHLRGRITTFHGAILDKLLLALTPIAGDGRPALPVARGLAFCDLLERLPADGLPDQAGANPTVVVTMTLEQLEGRLGAAGLDTGQQISAGEARRLACTAGVIPAVLGGRSQVLDLGRRTRFHSKPQRLAMTVRDRGCTAAGCDRPPACATRTTTSRGPPVGARRWRTVGCCAATTTGASTTRDTRPPGWRTARSGPAGGSDNIQFRAEPH